MRRLVLTTIVLLAAALLVTACGSSLPKGAIAKVGDATVTRAQFDALVKQEKAYIAGKGGTFPKVGSYDYNQYAAQLVAYLVQTEVIGQASIDMGVKVTSKDVTSYIAQEEKASGGATALNTQLKAYGMTRADLKEQVRIGLVDNAVYAKVVKGVKTPTDAEALAYYQKNKSKYVTPETRNVRHVLVKTKAEALTVRALLVTGASWQTVAKQYSTDSGSKNKGGLYANVKKGAMVAAFDKAAFSLKLNEISQPVKTQYGWHVIQVIKITKSSMTSFAKAKATIKSTLLKTQQNKVWASWYKQAVKDAKVKYANGYDPVKLAATKSASPSPSSSATDTSTASSTASSAASPSPSQTP